MLLQTLSRSPSTQLEAERLECDELKAAVALSLRSDESGGAGGGAGGGEGGSGGAAPQLTATSATAASPV